MIRLATEADISAILNIYGPYVQDTAYTFEYETPSLEVFTQRFRTVTAQFPWLVWQEEGRVLGYAYATAPFERAAYAWCAEPAIYLAPEAQRQGIGKKLYAALEALLELQGYFRLYALVTTDNAASVDFHLAVGYRELARFPDCGFKFGRWHGVTWLEKVLKSGDFPTHAPRSIWEIVESNKKLEKILDKLPLF